MTREQEIQINKLLNKKQEFMNKFIKEIQKNELKSANMHLTLESGTTLELQNLLEGINNES